MEKEQRSKLQKATQDARRLLEEEFSRQLLETYDINVAAGRWSEEPGAHLQAEQRLLREKLLAWIEHRSAQIKDEKEALLLALREMAFTALNRFVALKLMEARELVRPCVSGGLESEGFQEFTAVAQGLLVEQESSYRLYLETIFEDVSRELRALFDPRDPASLLWPKRTALLELLDILNRPELAELWREDETLGWIYQYFNGDAERKKMREESSAPRNSRELAVRNQFFTPRYVVEFLTDNTLGRIWHEMRQGDTGLKERCRYLVRRPIEIWLQPGEEAPAEVVADEALSQEELLRQPVHIPHRPLKDPREIRMLDPACGSMHFGLYAFDLYLAIYEEAWEIAQGADEQAKQGEAFAAFVAYVADFASKAVFLSEVPRLILLHNIHGVDIDPRATQIARLTLWLRAQRAWQEQGVEVAARPAITRSNVVCAEPMPGERELLADFVDEQFPEAERGLVQQLLEVIFDKMQLAGEAGSLLRIERDIRDVIERFQCDWQKLAIQQRELFSLAELSDKSQVYTSLNADLESLTKDFWASIEEKIYSALSGYAERAEELGGLGRRLFAMEAAQGFAFIDVCRKRYSVVVMNPPFGYAPDSLLKFIGDRITDIDALFVSRGIEMLCEDGMLGVITNRTQLMKPGLASFREEALQGRSSLLVCADLGNGVLDAMVETAAYVVSRNSSIRDALFANALSFRDKELVIRQFAQGENTRLINPSSFKRLPGNRFAHWLNKDFLEILCVFDKISSQHLVAFGLSTTDNFRFVRLRWEINQLSIKPFRAGCDDWVYFAKGGDYLPFAGDIHLAIDWRRNGAALRSMPGAPIRSEHVYGKAGLTYTMRTTSALAPRVLPAGCIPEVNGPSITSLSGSALSSYEILGILCSRVSSYLSDALVAAGDSAGKAYIPGVVGNLPIPKVLDNQVDRLVRMAVKLAMRIEQLEETSNYFSLPLSFIVAHDPTSANSRFIAASEYMVSVLVDCALVTAEYLEKIEDSFGLSPQARHELDVVVGPIPGDPSADTERMTESLAELAAMSNENIVSTALSRGITRKDVSKNAYYSDRRLELLASLTGDSLRSIGDLLREEHAAPEKWVVSELSAIVGIIFGRWDIRKASHRIDFSASIDPFATLPICPPGQLQDESGLPVLPDDAPSSYPLPIAWDGIIVDDSNHSFDIEASSRRVLEIIWPSSDGAVAKLIESSICQALKLTSLRDWFCRPASFFADHLQRYSRSRRQAPIYWQLSSGNGNYSIWLYYHRFTQDTPYRVLRDFVEPRIQEAEREQFEYESQGGLSGDAAGLLHEVQALLQDLRLFKSELELVAPLWNPNLNDGVIINHAILWRITPYTPWQKKCKECWDKLVKGDYDWAHLAFHLWPERVIRKCTTDRSLAIAHGLEERLWQETNNGNWLQRQVSEAELQALIAGYRKPAVQNALERFLAASPPVAAARTRAPRAAKSPSTGTTRRPRGSAPEVDAETSRQTLLVLTAAPSEGLGRNAIAELLAVEAASLTAVIKQLKEGGQIEQLGAARGAKYRLTTSGLAAVESQAGEDE